MSLAVAELAHMRFELPANATAHGPPETRGLGRDHVRLMAVTGQSIEHAWFTDLDRFLQAGDLLVVNASATIHAAAEAEREGGRAVVVHFASPLPDGAWVVELREPGGGGPQLDVRPGLRLSLASGAAVELLRPHRAGSPSRFWRATVAVQGSVEAWLQHHGRPITYGPAAGRWPLSMYQTVFAREPGSAEMPSAARPFTAAMVARLLMHGVMVAPVVLHATVSSPESGESPLDERYDVPVATARLVNLTRDHGGRVIAAGTTVARALETVAQPDGTAVAGKGWTDLVLSASRPARIVDALLTGWHEPGSSHLDLLESVAGPALVGQAYQAALAHGYRWHEFGDSCLLVRGAASPSIARPD